jgi:hypothetical protein
VRDEPEDTELEEQLRQVAARFEPVPADLLRAAVGAYTWRTIDADLAELVFDSAVDHDGAALVRGSQQHRLLSFRAGGLTIDVEIAGTGSDRSLIGQLVPPQPAAVEIRQAADTLAVEADELGRFSAGPLRAGPICLRCSTDAQTGGRAVVTDWVTI